MIFRTPLAYAMALFLGFAAAAGYFMYYALSRAMAVEVVAIAAFFLVAAILVARDLRVYRADARGLVVTHLITRRTLVVPYHAMLDIKSSYTSRARRYSPRYEEVHVRHPGGTVIVPFFDAGKRDAFADELTRARAAASS